MKTDKPIAPKVQADSEPSGSQQCVVSARDWRKQCPPEVFDGYSVLLVIRGTKPDFPSDHVGDVLDALAFLIRRRVERANDKLTDAGTQASD